MCSWAAAGAAPLPAHGIAWRVASTESEVEKAFAEARQSGKPVFLYWGAVWCPPCNQVKATLFSRPDFIERSKAFVPVYVDGDKPGAQKVASKFKVSGYPTMVLFKPDGSEVTRLPGEVDAERYLLTLAAGLNAQVPVKELATRALGRQALSPEQWRLLAYYSWETDQQQVAKSDELANKLSELSARVPADMSQVRDRLMLKAVAARAEGGSAPAATVRQDRAFVEGLLARRQDAMALAELLPYYSAALVKYLGSNMDDRATLAAKWDSLLAERMGGPITKVDVVDALDARIDMWKYIDKTDTLTPPRRQLVAHTVAQVVAGTTDRYERQAVVPSAAHVLTSAGLIDESDELLKAELPRAVAPYYHMLVLAGNAKKRGDAKSSLAWYEQAWKRSDGSATRIQWGTNYIVQILEQTPQDAGRVLSGASALIDSLPRREETFFERNARALQKMAKKLGDWRGQDESRSLVVTKIQTQLLERCRRVPAGTAGRRSCESTFAASRT
jgi:thiol-disulfide isomerase/thioredoxin